MAEVTIPPIIGIAHGHAGHIHVEIEPDRADIHQLAGVVAEFEKQVALPVS